MPIAYSFVLKLYAYFNNRSHYFKNLDALDQANLFDITWIIFLFLEVY